MAIEPDKEPEEFLDWLAVTPADEALIPIEDPLQKEREWLLNLFLYGSSILLTLAVPGVWISQSISQGLPLAEVVLETWFLAVFIPLSWLIAVARIPYSIKAGGWVLLNAVYVIAEFANSGLIGQSKVSFVVTACLATVFFSYRTGLLTTAGIALCQIVLSLLIQNQYLTLNETITAQFVNGQDFSQLYISWVVSFVLTAFMYRIIVEAYNSLRRQQELNQQVENEQANLEHQLNQRTQLLSITNEINQVLSTLLDRNTLVMEVVDLVQKSFGYYHVHIYLVDHETHNLRMVGGTGEAGKALLMGQHKLVSGQGLVGRAALMGIPLIVPDVSIDPTWLPNPLLPETKAEIAVPITAEDQIVGVLDVQHHIVSGLTEQDVDIIENVTNQIAIALRNAEVYERAQLKANREVLMNSIGQRLQLAPDIDTIFQTAARELGLALKAKQIAINLSPQAVQKLFAPPQTEER